MKRAFALILCLLCMAMAIGVSADEALPGYAQYVGGTDPECVLDYAYEYIDGYADAITADENVDVNIKEAVGQVRQDVTPFYATIWSIIPAIIAIVLALITKEV